MKLKSENRKKLAALKQALGKGIPLSALIMGAALAGGCSSERTFGRHISGSLENTQPPNSRNEGENIMVKGEAVAPETHAPKQPDAKPNAKNEKTPPPLLGMPPPPPPKK